MEVALNAFWLLVALASFLVWAPGKPRGGGRSASAHRLVVLACALFFLFPVISLTDDLHGEQPLVEDSVGSRRALLKRCSGRLASSDFSRFSSPPAHLRVHELLSPVRGAEGRVARASVVAVLSESTAFPSGRAPPLTLS